MQFNNPSSPHLHSKTKTSNIMLMVAVCTIPAVCAQVYFFGLAVLMQIALCVFFCCAFEVLFLKLRAKNYKFILQDNTALLTGLLLALSLPAYCPWWIACIGSLAAIVLTKQLYGGVGHNIFNPAMMAYAFVLISFPVQLSSWVDPAHQVDLSAQLRHLIDGIFLENYDVVTAATPLDVIKNNLDVPVDSSAWKLISLFYLAGGLFMLQRKIIKWHLPVAVIGSFLLLQAAAAMLNQDSYLSVLDACLSGSLIFGAFFIATDPVTCCATDKGKLIFGCIVGVLIYVIRTFGGYPDGVCFAVLFANMCAPLIDYLLVGNIYGSKKNV